MNSARFPILAEMARDVLAVPVSSVASESAFSTGGRLLDSFRSSLTPNLVQALVCLQDWLRSEKLQQSVSVEEDLDNLEQLEQDLASAGKYPTPTFYTLFFLGNFLALVEWDNAYPRHAAMAIAQVVMAFGHFFFAMGCPRAMYIGTLLVGLGYEAHWAIVPAAASELFGLKNFGALYNFLTIANPAGSLVFSSLVASSIYDMEAEKQAQKPHEGQLNLESVLTSFFTHG
ncbi:uncharacterized protein LOC129903566 [Solanum dulcamara]|uniref:uncharacterized protein LOC129903566 n=1 Tax=Solanum dulcamara TaxID=45834 RepID=UPI002486A624|nr:uncharacterized protein LOC129903566 [Solanum dulcamara]